MGDGANIGTALGSGAVDDQFRALVCEDEEWLDAALRGSSADPRKTRQRPHDGRSCPRTRRIPPGTGRTAGIGRGRAVPVLPRAVRDGHRVGNGPLRPRSPRILR